MDQHNMTPSQLALWRCVRGVSWWLVIYTFWRRGNGKHRGICEDLLSYGLAKQGMFRLPGAFTRNYYRHKISEAFDKKMRIFRKINHLDLLEFATYILQQCTGSGQLHGWISLDAGEMRCKWFPGDSKLNLNPSYHWPWEFQIRTARWPWRWVYRCAGPNAVWYIDRYDEIKPCCIGIHGCIDAYSRNFIPLEVCTTNDNPDVIAVCFVEAVRE